MLDMRTHRAGFMLALAVCGAACGGKVETDPSEGVRVVAAQLWMGCMPPAPAFGDTASMTVQVEYSNASGVERSWEIAGAWVEFRHGSKQDVLAFPLEPGSSGLVAPGERRVVTHVKKHGTGFGTVKKVCDYCGAKATWTLHLQWHATDGLTERTLPPMTVECSD